MKDIKDSLHLFTLLFSVLLLSGCEKADNEIDDEPDQPQEIKFNLFLKEGDNVLPIKAGDTRLSKAVDNDLSAGFLLYGVWNTTNMPTGSGSASETGKKFFDGTKMSPNEGSFDYAGDRCYWLSDNKTRHSFCARSIDPYVSTGGYGKGGNLTGGVLNTTQWVPVIDYYVHPDPHQQHDLLVAFGPTNIVVRDATPAVNLYFQHALSKIKLMVLANGGATLYVQDIKITYTGELYRQGNIDLTSATKGFGSATKVSGKSYTLNSDFIVPPSAFEERSAYNVGDILVLPQTVTGSWLTVELTYGLSETETPKTVKLGIPGNITFSPGFQYKYYIKVSDRPQELTISNIVLEAWKTEKLEVDPL